ncbi:hypothetical protein IPM19_00840 [bacterium]|nr:MAG: hypothetical protein IPM19_00840 [bacterium]
MFKKTFASLIAVAAMVVLVTPSLALAHGDKNRDRGDNDRNRNRAEVRAQNTNQFGVRVFDNNQKNGNHDKKRGDHNKRGNGLMLGLLYAGTVTAESSTGFTIKTRDDSSFTVNATGATVIEIPRTTRALADIDVNDRVFITGTKSGSTITASVIYFMPENIKPATAKGTVTTVSAAANGGATVTVENKDGQTATVNITEDTQIKTADNEAGAVSDVQVGTKVKLFGLWDSVLNVFNAIKVRII